VSHLTLDSDPNPQLSISDSLSKSKDLPIASTPAPPVSNSGSQVPEDKFEQARNAFFSK